MRPDATSHGEFMMRSLKLLVAVLVLGAGPVRAAHPGFVDLGGLEGRANAAPKVSVTLGDRLLRFAGEAAAAEDPELAVMQQLESLQVRVYENADAALAEGIADFARDLGSAGWQSVVTVSEGAERVRVLMKPEGDHIAGVTVLVFGGGGEAVLVNAYGEIRPEELGNLVSIPERFALLPQRVDRKAEAERQ